MTRNAIKRVLVGLIIVAMVAQPIAPIVGSAAAANSAPDPNIEGPTEVGMNVNATFTAEGTTDDSTDYQNLTFRWDFNGDGLNDQAGLTVEKSWSEPGEYQVTLTVEDEDGLKATETIYVKVPEAKDGGTLSDYKKAALAHPFGAVVWASQEIVSDDSARVASIRETSKEGRLTTMYQNGKREEEYRDAITTMMENYGNDAKALASQDAKYAIAEAYSEGADLPTARNRSIEAIEDRFSRMQLQLIERWEARAAQARYHYAMARESELLNLQDSPPDPPGNMYYLPDGYGANIYPLPNLAYQTTTLANGSTVTYETVEIRGENMAYASYQWYEVHLGAFPNPSDRADKGDSFEWSMGTERTNNTIAASKDGGDQTIRKQIHIRPQGNVTIPDATVLETREWWDSFALLNESSAELVQEYENATAESIYLALEDGKVEPVDVYSAETMIREMSGDDPANMTDFGLTLATMSSLGLDHPAPNQTGKMVIEVKGVTIPKPGNVSATHVARKSVNDSTNVILSSGYNVTLQNHLRTWGVFAEYDDGRRIRIPRDHYEIKDGSEYVIDEWTARPNGTVTNVSVEIVESAGDSLEKVYIEDTVTGMLFSDNLPDSGAFEVGKTYHTGNIDGMEMIATFNGTQIHLKGQFTVKEAYQPDGTQVQNVTWQEYDYQVESSDDFVNDTEELKEQIQVIIEREDEIASGGAGGGDTSDSSFNLNLPSFDLGELWGIPIWLIIVLVLAAVLIAGS